MATAILNVKVDSQIKTRAKQAAERLGLNLSGLVNAYLRNLINTESVQFSTYRKEVPNSYLIKAIRSTEKDIALGKTVAIEDPDKALAYLNTLNKKNKKRYAD